MVTSEKILLEEIKKTGFFSGAVVRVVGTTTTIVAYLVDRVYWHRIAL
jgi:phosphomevalonate kinase